MPSNAGEIFKDEAFKHDVFLNYNHADKPQVRRLASRLKEAGILVWLDEWVIEPGAGHRFNLPLLDDTTTKS